MDFLSIFKLDKDNNVLLDADYCEFYIPKSYFDSSKKFAEDYSDEIRVFGIFNVGIFEKGKLVEIKNLNNPNMMKVFVYESEWRDVAIAGNKPEKCKVLKYLKNQVLFTANHIKSTANAEMFLSFLVGGCLPKNIPYTKVLQIWRKNIETNDMNYGVCSAVLEMILAVSFRCKDRPEYKFAKQFGKSDSVSEFDYDTASIRQICQYASTFTSIIFEDFDSMVTASINRTREGKEEAESPLESIIKM